MSRTNHHRGQKHQHCGDDLWSRRPCAGRLYSAYNKWLTRKKERAAKRSQTTRDWQESDDDRA